MGTYLAILNGAADPGESAPLTPEQDAKFLGAWGLWAQTHAATLVDPGAPLLGKKIVTADGAKGFSDAKVAYAIVRAESHEAAVQIFSEHPHLTLMPGNSIEVLECSLLEEHGLTLA